MGVAVDIEERKEGMSTVSGFSYMRLQYSYTNRCNSSPLDSK